MPAEEELTLPSTAQNMVDNTAKEDTTTQLPPAAPELEYVQPIPFPNPLIRRSTIRKVEVIIDGVIVKRTVIDSGVGRLYEIGTVIKKAIFGQVVRTVELILTTRQASPEASVVSEMGRTTISASTMESNTSSLPDIPLYCRSNNNYAIKVYSKRILRAYQGRTAENPLTEITALQYIGDNHPNVMGQVECLTDDENIYSIMRYCNGCELFDHIDRIGVLTNNEAKNMIKQIINGLLFLQERGIAHRDLSLENIMYDKTNNQFIIIDFGMCLRMPYNTVTQEYPPIARQSVCGKKNYISPEVLRGDAVFNPMLSDMWAVGIILFIALTGVPPVDSAIATDNRYLMICNNQLQDMVTAWNLGLDPDAVDLMQKLLQPIPTNRLTIQQVLNHRWLTG